MSETQTGAPTERNSGRGKHRGPAAGSEESQLPAQGRHRRPVQDGDQQADGVAAQAQSQAQARTDTAA
ncbi:hypothetical protein ACWGJ2_26665 [Streptomyces sp. NPDC054796]